MDLISEESKWGTKVTPLPRIATDQDDSSIANLFVYPRQNAFNGHSVHDSHLKAQLRQELSACGEPRVLSLSLSLDSPELE